MIVTNNNIGFKGFVKNLRKYLKDECNTTLTQSQTLEITSQLLGFKNYNIFQSKEKNLENTIKFINIQIDNNTKLITNNSMNCKIYSFVDDIVEYLNRKYLNYIDDKGRFLYFSTPKSFHELKKYDAKNIILLRKLYLSSLLSSSNAEEHIIEVEYDKDGIPFIPKENEVLKELTKGFLVVPFKQYKNDVGIGVVLKNPKK